MTTITQALAELKLADKKIAVQADFVRKNIARNEGVKDPFEKQGGSPKLVAEAMQSIKDLFERKITLRRAIAKANDSTSLTILDKTMTISEWLIWRRDVAPGLGKFTVDLGNLIQQTRERAQKNGQAIVPYTALGAETELKASDIVVNADELSLHRAHQTQVEILGVLDGELSMLNATTSIVL